MTLSGNRLRIRCAAIALTAWTLASAAPAGSMGVAFADGAAAVRMLTASDGAANDRFGYSLAVSGDTLVVGAPGANAAYVFRRSADVWTQEAKLTEASTSAFGYSVAIDGDTVVVGDPEFLGRRGGAFVCRRTGATWAWEADLFHVGGQPSDVFGDSVAVSGNTAMVGAPLEGDWDDGAVHTFTRTGTTWTSAAAPSLVMLPGRGSSVAVSGTIALWCSARLWRCEVLEERDGAWAVTSTLVTGSSSLGEPHDTQDMGAALDGDTAVVSGRTETYVFRHAGAAWTEEARIPAARAVAIDGDRILLGGDDAAILCTRSGTTWTQRASLAAPGAGGTERTDGSVAVLGDEALVGAPRRDSSQGAVLVFDLHFPRLAAAPADVTCERTAVGLRSSAGVVTLSNQGEVDLHVTSVSVAGGDSGDFLVAPAPEASFAPTIAPGASAAFTVTFAPHGTGARLSALRVESDDALYATFDVPLHGDAAVCVTSPTTGTIGTVVTVQGAGFGTKRGKLLVLGGTKPLALKITHWNAGNDGAVTGVITGPRPPGAYHACVAPPRAARIVDPTTFTFAAPAIVGVSPSGGPKGTEVFLACTALGTTKGSVYLQAPGAKKRIKCTVTVWPRDAASATGQGAAKFRVPKKLVGGTAYDVVVVNKVGEARAVGAFTAP